jgi:hypothetical protein
MKIEKTGSGFHSFKDILVLNRRVTADETGRIVEQTFQEGHLV